MAVNVAFLLHIRNNVNLIQLLVCSSSHFHHQQCVGQVKYQAPTLCCAINFTFITEQGAISHVFFF